MGKHAKHVPVPRSFEEAAIQDQQRRKRETNTVREKQRSCSCSKHRVSVFSVITCSEQQGGLRAQGTCVVPPTPDLVSALLLLIFYRKHTWSKEALGQEATFGTLCPVHAHKARVQDQSPTSILGGPTLQLIDLWPSHQLTGNLKLPFRYGMKGSAKWLSR